MTDQLISKKLSANDTGETGGHQAGILIPKDPKVLSYFPTLDKAEYNPRMTLFFSEENDPTQKWTFEFIYYNNKLFSEGTRNEYRLTGMTNYFRAHNLVAGDDLVFGKREGGIRFVGFRRKHNPEFSKSGALKLGSSWKVINLEGEQ